MLVHFSSATDLHATPQDFFDKLNSEFGFELDVCAPPENAKCSRYFTKQHDGLAQEWGTGAVWMNPPYGREIGAWMRKANDAAKNGATVVCLVPARTDTRWWHEYAAQHEVRFVRGRLKFGGAKNSAPFPSAVVIIKPFPPSPRLLAFSLEQTMHLPSFDIEVDSISLRVHLDDDSPEWCAGEVFVGGSEISSLLSTEAVAKIEKAVEAKMQELRDEARIAAYEDRY